MSRRGRTLLFLALLAIAGLTGTLAHAATILSRLTHWGVSHQIQVIGGVCLGLLLGVLGTAFVLSERRLHAVALLALISFGTLALAAAWDQISFAKAGLLILVGGAGFVALSRAIALLLDGGAIELHSQWGGLGGGLGGWRVSPAASLLLIGLALTGFAVGIALSDGKDQSKRGLDQKRSEQTTASSGGTSAGAGEAGTRSGQDR